MNPDVKTYIKWSLGVIALIAIVILASNVFATVEADRFHVKQAWVTGNMSARLQPGMYGQWFGTVWTFPKSETFYFIKDEKDAKAVDQSVHVRFDDGSPADVSGTIRVNLNVSVDQAIGLVKEHRLTNWTDVETKLVLPTIRRTLILTATTMNATESYQNRRDDFINMVTDQLDNGFYETEDQVTEVT
jgi:hypothetical protein